MALVASSILRLDLYVEAYGLTRLRVAAFVWMGLVAAGLGLMLWQIGRDLAPRWLVARSALLSVVTLWAMCFVNVDGLIARWNLARPDLPDCGPIFRTLWFAGAANLLRDLPEEKRALLDPGLREVSEQGAQIPLLDYLAAVKAREAVGLAMKRFHDDYDLLLTPTLPIPAFEAGQEQPGPVGRWVDWTPFSYPINLSQQPAASVPCGLTAAGLPAGLHIVGPPHRDGLVLKAAAAYEALVGGFPLPALA